MSKSIQSNILFFAGQAYWSKVNHHDDSLESIALQDECCAFDFWSVWSFELFGGYL